MQLVSSTTQLAAQTLASTTSQQIDLKGFDQVALQVNYANATTGAKTFTSGLVEVDQITFAAKGSTTNGDYFVIHDYLGGSWAVGLDTLGTGAATPTGAAWVAVPAANKVYTDISSATTGSDVELLVATAINALTGFTAVITTGNSTTHMNCTNAFAGVVVTPAVYSRAGASGTGSVTFSITTAGTASKVNPAANTITIAAHGQVTGSKGQLSTSSALPTGFSTSTDYFAIVVDANTLKFADSLVHAVAGTAITMTSSGVGTQTFTPTTSTGNVIKAQASVDGVTFTDITAATFPVSNIAATVTVATSTGAVTWDLQRPSYRYINILFTPSAGQITFSVWINAKNDK